MKRITIDYKKCTGCLACKRICKAGAISTKKDGEGFVYPFIDENKCIDCGMCSSVCHLKHAINLENHYTTHCYSFWNEEKISIFSTSGGAFYNIALSALHKGFVVYASSWNSSFELSMKRINGEDELLNFTKSRYIQSNIEESLDDIKNDLLKQKKVFVCACPCQIAAIKHFVGFTLLNNLYCADLVCHGVASKFFLDKYVFESEQKYGKIHFLDFRSKKHGWKNKKGTYVEAAFDKKNIIRKSSADPFMKSYYAGYLFRNSCYCCDYSTKAREGDLTLGDFFEISERINNKTAKQNGISLILVNTNKGNYLATFLLDNPKHHLDEQDISLPFNKNESLFRPFPIPLNRNVFLNDCINKGLYYSSKKNIKYSLKHRIALIIGLDTVEKIKRLLGHK